MRIFKNIWFDRYARKQRISDQALLQAVARVERGLIDADLGGGVIKQRVARQGQGRSGGYRSIVLYRTAERAFFVYAFAKSERSNIEPDEEAAFKQAAAYVLAVTESELNALIKKGKFLEIEHEQEIPK